MAVEGKKVLLRQIPRVKLWLVLVLTGCFTVVLLAAAHLTHSLTLRVEAYHALYNLLSLVGCLLTMKLCSKPQTLHNTFGWARMEVLTMLTTLLFFLALCFSVAIESIQTAAHAEHQDAMHHPLPVMALGAVGLCLSGLVFILIGGYTHHQGCFLEMRDSGSVWVGRQVRQEDVQAGRRMLSSNDLRGGSSAPRPAVLLAKEIIRDAIGLVIVEICAAVVYWDKRETVARYIDPALAVTSAVLLMWLSYPYGKECGQILLQTIPGHIDVEAFQTRVLEQFPDIVNIHHLHIWTFTPSKVVATAHVVFSNPRVYLATQPALMQFFNDEGITHVTLQPECLPVQPSSPGELPVCLLRCQHDGCQERECCLSWSSHPLLTQVTTPTTRKRGVTGDSCHSHLHHPMTTLEGSSRPDCSKPSDIHISKDNTSLNHISNTNTCNVNANPDSNSSHSNIHESNSSINNANINSQNFDSSNTENYVYQNNTGIKESNTNISKSNRSVNKSNTSINTSGVSISQSKTDVNQSNTSIDKCNTSIDKTNTNINTSTKDIDNSNATNSSSTSIINCNTNMNNSNTDINNSNTDINNSNTDINNSNTDINNSNTDINNSNTDINNSNTDINNSNTDINNSNTSINKNNTSLTQSTTSLNSTTAPPTLATRGPERPTESTTLLTYSGGGGGNKAYSSF